MENKIQLFQNKDFGEIRAIEINGEPWLVGKDVAKILGYSNTNDAISRHVDDEDKRGSRITTPSGIQEMTVINESGVYALVFSSKLDTARQFKHWVTKEVLPSIRKNGGYIAGQEQMNEHEIIANALVVAHKILAEREERLKAVEAENLLMKPKAEYFDELVDRATNINFRDGAKELGVKPNYFVNFLLSKKFIYRDQNGKLRPYQTSVDRGLFVIKECYSNYGKWSGCQTLITPKGRATFKVLLGKLKR